MKRISPRTTVLGGASLGIIAGAAIYGAVSSASVGASAPVSLKTAQVSAAKATAPGAACAAGQELEHGVCIVHVKRVVRVEKVVVLPAPAMQASSAVNRNSGSSSSGNLSAVRGRNAAEVEHGTEHGVEHGVEHEVEHLDGHVSGSDD